MSRAPSPAVDSFGRYASEPRALSLALDTPAQLAHVLHVDALPWELVVEGHREDHIGIGEAVRVTVAVSGHTPHQLRGVILWRRLRQGPGYPEAVGVRIDPTEGAAVAHLRAIAVGQFEDDVRDVLRWRASRQQRFA